MSGKLPWRLLRALTLAACAILQPAQATRIVIATVDNSQMRQLQELGAEFERANPDIRLQWVVLKENALRRLVGSDITTATHQFDVVTIGLYEAALWPPRGWLAPLATGPGYDLADLLPSIRAGLSYRGMLYGAPLYGESSVLMYRKDLLRRAGLRMPAAPTWEEVAVLAARLDDKANGVHGICLRANPGWGANMALVTTMVNAYGGQWFDMRWRPQLRSQAWQRALGMYVRLLRNYGPPDPLSKGFNENLALFQAGKCALWVDATVAAGNVSNPKQSPHAGAVGFAPAPAALTSKGSRWLWCWALAVPAGTEARRQAAAQAFVAWATSRDYVRLVASRKGWAMVPSGTRASTYAEREFRRAAPWAADELAAIRHADMHDATLPRSPYAGVQFAAIPPFETIGDEVGRYVAEAVAARSTVDEALERSQRAAERLLFFE